MPVRKAEAVWEGKLSDGKGEMRFGDGGFEGVYSASSRFEEGSGSNPEQLLGAAHAGCFSMALAAELGRAGSEPKRVHTVAEVRIEKLETGWTVTHIQLNAMAVVPGLDEAKFLELAEKAKENCPISRALKAVEIGLDAKLVG